MDLIGDALAGFSVTFEQGSAVLRAAAQAINTLNADVLTDPNSASEFRTWSTCRATSLMTDRPGSCRQVGATTRGVNSDCSYFR